MEAATARNLDEYGPATPRHDPPQARTDGGGATDRAPETFFVLDTTAVAATGHEQEDRAKGRGPRVHQLPVVIGGQRTVKTFTFEPGKPLKMPIAHAIKFLKNKEFVRTDEDGNELPYNRQPKQPEELGAGERFKLDDNQTIAHYGELTNTALWQRALELPGGEAIDRQNRQALMSFLVASKVKKREENLEKEARARAEARKRNAPEADDGDEFLPAPEPETGDASAED